MRVKLVAATLLMDEEKDDFLPYKKHPFFWGSANVTPADELGELAGRLCYKSWSRPNPATATNEGYLANILAQGHYSVLEHASATFWISGVSRSLTHELVRHRHLSFSQVSQRYVDESEGETVLHPALEVESSWQDDVTAWTQDSRAVYEGLVERLVKSGVDRKTARGAARSVLPNAVATEIIVTGNHGAWRDVLRKRLAPGADAEIRELARLLLGELKELAPNTYQDFDTNGLKESK